MFHLVQTFHRAFGHPVADTLTTIHPWRLETRVAWTISELFELRGSFWPVKQIDALIDAMVFCVGTLVEVSPTCPKVAIPWKDGPHSVRTLSEEELTAMCDALSRQALRLAKQSTEQGQITGTIPMITHLSEILSGQVGVNPLTFFRIVMAANMSKLWPDGKPRYDADGKIKKPPTFQPPEPLIEQELHRLWKLAA